ncbi:MAG: phage scaffolding protein [Oscillospiraceae bacterium]|nr:phage scaffolding protein [Oscillospiraceae bacterium]
MATENINAESTNDGDKLSEKNGGNSAEIVEFLKKQITELLAELKEKDGEIRKVKVNAAVDAALIAAGAKNVVAVKALITGLDEAELSEDGSVKGLEEKISAVKASDGYLFEQRGGKVTMRGAKPGESGSEGIDGNADISKMTYSQLADYIRKNPDAKIFD